MIKVIILLIGVLGLWACNGDSATVENIQEYNGPIIEIENGETIFTDSAIIKLKLQAKVQLEYENGNREFPEGVYIEFYEKGEMIATLNANSGYYNEKSNKYTALGDVVVENLKEKNKLNTEELHWTPQDRKIFTDKFVRIESETELIMGEGLIADQDMTSYEILKPTAVVDVNEEF